VTAPARTLDPRAAVAARLRRQARSEARWSKASLVAGIVILAAIVGTSFVAPFLGFDDPTGNDLPNALLPPSLEHPFGTDALGRDVFTRVNYGTRIDLVFGVVTTYIPLVVGVLLGALAGYVGGWFDAVFMRLVDFVIAFPLMVLVLAVVAVLGAGITAAYIGILLVAWALYARLTRGEMLVVREQQYIMAARGLGYSTPRIILRHALPNVVRASLVFSMADIVLNILTLAGLSYLGLGVAPPTPEWGAIVAEGQPYLRSAWWISTFSGLTIVLAGVSFSLIGDALADRLGTDFRVSA
jgi:peptide/nickel transport system permease protein